MSHPKDGAIDAKACPQAPDVPEKASTPKVSVIVPVKNSEDYLPILLHQLHEQNYSDFEVLIIDAGSTDRSIAVAREYSKCDPRFSILDEACDGKSAARNLGIERCRGEYVISFDADDMINSDILERMVSPLKKYKTVDIVLCDMDQFYDPDWNFRLADWIVDKDVIPANTPFKAADIDGFYKALCGYPTNKMIRKSLYDRYGLRWLEIAMHDDMSLTQVALSLARKIYFIDDRLYHARVRRYDPANTEFADANYECMFEALFDIRRLLKKHKIWKKFKNAFNDYALDQCRWKYFAVTPDARQGAHDTLKDTWLEKLGLLELEAEDVENAADFLWMRQVLETSEYMAEPPQMEVEAQETGSSLS